MQSKNKKRPSARESEWISFVKSCDCVICHQAGPSDAHEIRQGDWFTSLPLCRDCHEGPVNGLHGQRHMWKIRKLDEIAALNLFLSTVIPKFMEACSSWT